MTDATSNRREPVKYAWVGDTSIAYQVLGSGPIDLIYMQGFLSNVELNWEHPLLARFLRELARFSRLIIVDRRGIGCSERFTPADTPPIEALVDDVTAVIDAESSDRPVMFATGDCVFIAALFAASHPDRLSGLVLYGGASTWRKTEEISWGMTGPELEKDARTVRDELGKGLWFKQANPSIASDRREIAWGGRYERLSLTPGSVYYESLRFSQIDIGDILPAIQTPTLVLHRIGDTRHEIESGRYMSEHIRTARFVELAGIDHFPWFGNQDTIIRKVEKFLETVRADEASFDRVLATVMFTDIVESTDTVASLGDRSWAALLDQHRRVFRSVLARYKGREVKTTGDGFLAIFDGPARAVRCAQEAVSAVRAIGLDIRVGCHIGEIELEDDDVQGITVHIAARISALANGGEVLVSRTMTELVAGSGFIFEDRGTYELKGVPGKWHLFLAGNPE